MHLVPVYTVKLVRERETPYSPTLKDSTGIAAFLSEYLKDLDREHFVVLLLDNKHQILGINTVSVGSLSATLVHPREVFKPAVLASAAAVVLCHNHISGDPTPSDEDKLITRKLVLAGETLGIPVMDHLVVTEHGGFFSFHDHNLL